METIKFFRLSVFLLFVSCGGFQSIQDIPKIEVPEDLKELPVSKTKPSIVKITKSVFETPQAKQRKNTYGKTNAFREGEKVTMALTWFSIKAGDVTLEVRPSVYMYGRKTYHFVSTAKSSPALDLIHSVDDWIESYVDQETFYPYKSSLHGIETDRIREGLVLFDYNRSKIEYWSKRVHVKKGTKEKRRTDDLVPGVLDMFSSAFFLRALPLKVGKKFSVVLYNEGKHISVEAEVLRKEKLDTELGTFDALVVRPVARFEGILQTSGDSTIWVTDDPRHLILKLETKIKIGYLMGKIKKIEDSQYKLPKKEK